MHLVVELPGAISGVSTSLSLPGGSSSAQDKGCEAVAESPSQVRIQGFFASESSGLTRAASASPHSYFSVCYSGINVPFCSTSSSFSAAVSEGKLAKHIWSVGVDYSGIYNIW